MKLKLDQNLKLIQKSKKENEAPFSSKLDYNLGSAQQNFVDQKLTFDRIFSRVEKKFPSVPNNNVLLVNNLNNQKI